MKPVMLFLLLALVITGTVSSQNYYVINTEGKIYADSKLLKTGDKLSEDMKLTFSSLNDKLYLLSPEKGNFLITPEKNQGDRLPGWIVTLKQAIPESKFYKTASRGDDNEQVFNDIYDLMGFFRDKVTFIPETRFKINGDKIPLDENNYFIFRSLSQPGKALQPGYTIGPGYFTLTGADNTNLPDNQIEMSYSQGGKKTLIGNFILDTRSRTTVRTELSLFFRYMDVNTSNPAQVYYEQVLPYVAQSYGNTDLNVIRDIIRKDLEIQLQLAE